MAGITITYVLGDNSVFKKASDAKLQTEIAKIEERASLIYSDMLLEKAKDTNNLRNRPTMQEIVNELREERYNIEQIEVSGNVITGITLDKENMTLGYGKSNTFTVTLESIGEPYNYYVLINGKYYKMNFNNGLIAIDRTESEISETGDSTAPTLIVSSGDTTVATAIVDNTTNVVTVTATNKAGTVAITITYGEYTKNCNVKVCDAATGISLNETSYVVTGGDSWTNELQLIATVTPANADQEVNWKSSDENIATVDSNGLVKATEKGKGGNIKIIATTKDGTNLSVECAITVEMFSAIKKSKTEYIDNEENKAIIPQNFAVGTSDNVNTITGGLVIQDNEGNQFVWIPVEEFKNKNGEKDNITLGRYTFNTTNGTPKLEQNADNYTQTVTIQSYYRELTSSSTNTPAKNLSDFVTKTKANGGYYFGRYEASQGTDEKAKVKYDKETWVNITQASSADKACNMYTNNYVESDLINSYSWDTAIVFIQKYSGNSNYANENSMNTKKMNTGKVGDKEVNIYDMASNCSEWSTEFTTDSPYPCSIRGGSGSDLNRRTSCRSTQSITNTYPYLSFRPILYIK